VTCKHGQPIGVHSGIVQNLIDEYAAEGHDDTILLEWYTACDCCDVLMHKSTCGESYAVLDDGRTLCVPCQED